MGWGRGSYLVAAGLSLALIGCHALSEETPTEPTETQPTQPSQPPTETLAPLAIPVILPTPEPTPIPTPPPAPAPPAAPPSTPPAPTGSCSLPASNPAGPVCTDDSPQLLRAIENAITAVTESRPEIFDFHSKKCEDCYYIKNVDAYLTQVIKQLNNQGVCALWDGEEIAAKNSNNFSEQWDILLSSGHIRRGAGAYRGVCRPAIF